MPRKKLQRSTESYGQGQSGYAAGRLEGDPAIGIVARNLSYPTDTDAHVDAGDDERFTGAGFKAWVPKEQAWLSEVPEEDIEAEPSPEDPDREPDPERSPERAQPVPG